MAAKRQLWLLGFSLLAVFLLVGCSGELARVHIQSTGDFEAAFQNKGNPVAFWTDFDIEYESKPSIYYEIAVYQDGKLVAELVCDPFDTNYTRMMRNVEVRGVTKESYLGIMNCSVDLPEGELTLLVTLHAEGQVTIFRADLVLKEGS